MSVLDAFSQGQIILNNRVNGIIVAPVYGLEPANPQLSKRGNTSTGTPSGSQTYAGLPLVGSGFTAQLFAGATNALSANLQPLMPEVHFRTGDSAGFLVAPGTTLTVPGVREGEPAKVILRAWDNRGNTLTNWLQAAGRAEIAKGESWAFITPPLGGPFIAPPNLVGLESFNLSTGAVWRAGTKINFQPAGSTTPVGYSNDAGTVFSARPAGPSYGWNTNLSASAIDRDATNAPDQRHDTFIRMPAGAVWEIGVSNGLYGVHVCLGDSAGTNTSYRVEAEGSILIEGPAAFRGKWMERDELVWVADRRLTIRSVSSNTPICFIEIAPVEGPRLQLTPTVQTPALVALDFAGEVGLNYRVESSANLQTWVPLGIATHSRGDRFRFTHTNSPAGLYRFYRIAVVPPP